MSELPPILDACCGGRMFYFDKHDPRVLGMDIRRVARRKIESNGSFFEVRPDLVGDFRKMPFGDESFQVVVFDPPHLKCGETSFMSYKYGTLFSETWEVDLRDGFSECFRVLKPGGVLLFKWSDSFQPLNAILALTKERPVLYSVTPSRSKKRKTYFVVFVKG